MTDLDPSADPPEAGDLQRLESRIDAKLLAIVARLVLADGRFAALNDRINQHERYVDTLSTRMQAHLDRIIDALIQREQRVSDFDTRITSHHAGITQAIQEANQAHSRTVRVGLLAVTLVNAALCLATVLVAR